MKPKKFNPFTSKPYPPYKPVEPSPVIKEDKVVRTHSLYDGETFTLSSFTTTHIKFERDRYEDSGYNLLEVEEIHKPNPNYEKQYKSYEKQLEKYNKDMETYKERNKEYEIKLKEYKKEEKDKQVEARKAMYLKLKKEFE